ncbi:hypothetical protein D3C72_1544440 [compost metagenome]
MVLVVQVQPVAEIAALAALAHDHDAGVVQHGRAGQRPVGAQHAHAGQGRQVVALVGGQAAQQRSHGGFSTGGAIRNGKRSRLLDHSFMQ